ncbi:MAG: polysaccharide biosynthesis tyrosine autokinase [Pirellulales bacterium]
MFGTLMPIPAELPPGLPTPWRPAAAPAPPVTPAVTASSLLTSLRRRWWIGAGLGILIATGFAIGSWVMIPSEAEVSALVVVRRGDIDPLSPGWRMQKDEFETLKRTMAGRVKSRSTLAAAIDAIDKDTGVEINRLPLLRLQPDPIQFLTDALKVDFAGESELMMISLSGPDPKEVVKIVNSIKNVYVADAQQAETQERNDRLQKVKAKLTSITTELMSKRKALKTLADSLGVSDPEALAASRQTKMAQATQISQSISQYKARLTEIRATMIELQNQLDTQKNAYPSDQEILDYLMKDRVLEEKMKERDLLAGELRRRLAVTTDPKHRSVVEVEMQLDAINTEIQDYLDEHRQRAIEAITGGQFAIKKLEGEIAAQRQKQETYEAELKTEEEKHLQLIGELANFGKRSPELEELHTQIRRFEDQQSQVEGDMVKLEVANTAPIRVVSYEDAIPPEHNREVFKYVAVGFAALFGFCLPIFGVTFWDFQQFRVNTAQETATLLGVKTLGIVPPLVGRSGRKAVAAQTKGGPVSETGLQRALSDSIDAVRTALMRDAAAEGTRVVLVTSAAHHEGKTTVASQLAASLARAGRRTLLIDGDLRRPSVHRLFGLSPEPGLGEVLRREAEMDEAIRPTRASGLWALTTGHCDDESVQDLAKEQVHEMFAELRAGFDFVIIDSAPVLALADPLVIGQYVDTAIVTALRDVSRVPQVHEACERLRGVGVRILGVVFGGMKQDVKSRRGSARLPARATA